MTGLMSRFLTFLFSCLLVAFSVSSCAAEKVVLQLKWEHEFQFAGYYAALWQGFYAEQGLDVEIRPASRADGTMVQPAEELSAGRADFAIGAIDILIQRDRGQPFVVLAPIFQRSPNRIFTLASKPVRSLAELSELTIGVSDDFILDEVKALFNENGFNSDHLKLKHLPPTIDVLLSNEVDAVATYGVSLSYAAKERGVELHELNPEEFGLQFSGDTLFTHQRMIGERPKVVEKFLKATLKGWNYALEHRSDIAQRIASDLPRNIFTYDDLLAYNLSFAKKIDEYLSFPYTELGYTNTLRWRAMHSQLKALGLLDNEWDEGVITSLGQKKEINIADSDLKLTVFFHTFHKNKL